MPFETDIAAVRCSSRRAAFLAHASDAELARRLDIEVTDQTALRACAPPAYTPLADLIAEAADRLRSGRRIAGVLSPEDPHV